MAGGFKGKLTTPVMDAPPPSPRGALPAIYAKKAGRKLKLRPVFENRPVLPSGSGSSELPSGSGCLSTIAGIQWEAKPDGAFEAWHAPLGNEAPRRTKTYLGRVGVRLLRQWGTLADGERRAVVADWVSEKRKGKGLY